MSNLQIRITEASWDKIKEVLGWYLVDHLAFRHQPTHNPENIHHHVYLFDINRTAESVRNLFKKAGYEKTSYAVSTTCGSRHKVPITKGGAFQYAWNPKSNPQLVSYRGFTDEDLSFLKSEAEAYYKPLEVTLVTKEEHYIVRPDRVWERLRDRQINGDFDGLTIRQIKSKIAADCLNSGKAIMRNADLHRYALSIVTLCKYKNQEVPADALNQEYYSLVE